MNHTRKMIIVPEESLKTSNIEKKDESKPSETKEVSKKRIERDVEKIQKLILIVLKIARNNGYNENLKLVDEDGRVIEKSDLVSLLNHSLTHQKALFGEERFVQILFESGVDPNLIVNENVRSKLLALESRTPVIKTHMKPILPENNINKVNDKQEINVLNRELKRKREENEDEPTFKKSKIDWDILSDDEGEME